VDGEPYVVDGHGFHKEADYVVCSKIFCFITFYWEDGEPYVVFHNKAGYVVCGKYFSLIYSLFTEIFVVLMEEKQGTM
jgi:hypothetical protein